MNTSPKHRRLVSGLLLACSVVSLLLFFQLRYLPTPSLQMYEQFTGGTLRPYPFWLFTGSLVRGVLILTAALAVWNFRMCRRQS
jgi:hypothetical protein